MIKISLQFEKDREEFMLGSPTYTDQEMIDALMFQGDVNDWLFERFPHGQWEIDALPRHIALLVGWDTISEIISGIQANCRLIPKNSVSAEIISLVELGNHQETTTGER